MKILLTGATGYLGSHALRRLMEEGYELVIVKRSFSNISRIAGLIERCPHYDIDKQPLEKIFDDHEIGIILHCATDYGRKRVDHLRTFEANLLLPLQLLEFGRRHGVKAFINTDTILDKGVNTYSLSKNQFKEWLSEYSAGMTCCNIALEHFYGPGDDVSKFVSFVVDAFLRNVESIPLTEGRQLRDFIYIDDVVESMMYIVNASKSMQKGFYKYEIGTGDSISIRNLVELIKELSGNTVTRLDFGAIPYRANEVMGRKTDIAAIRELGWAASRSLEEGLRLMISEEMEMRKE